MPRKKDETVPTGSPLSPDAEDVTLATEGDVSATTPDEGVDYGGGLVIRADNTENLPRPYQPMNVVG